MAYGRRPYAPRAAVRRRLGAILSAAGASSLLFGWSQGKPVLQINLRGRDLRFELQQVLEQSDDRKIRKEKLLVVSEKWLHLADLIVAKIVNVERGHFTFDQEFLYFLVAEDGCTIGDLYQQKLLTSARFNQESKAKGSQPMGRSFASVHDFVFESRMLSWKSKKHGIQWKRTFETYATKILPMDVGSIDASDVLQVLTPIWAIKPATAVRLRGRIAMVLDAASALGYRSGSNPAAWTGSLEHFLVKVPRTARGHHEAMPYARVPQLMELLSQKSMNSSRALMFLILTATRVAEVLGAQWDEFDLDECLWTLPSTRTKSAKEHRVPLSPGVLAILHAQMADAQPGKRHLVFPGRVLEKPYSGTTLALLMRRLGVVDATVHGFRSSFSDWVGDTTSFSTDLVSQALAHVVGDRVIRSYRRGDALRRRRQMMEEWSAFCLGQVSSMSCSS